MAEQDRGEAGGSSILAEFLGKLWDAGAEAVADIRKKTEEVFWGREVTPAELTINSGPNAAEGRVGFHDLAAAAPPPAPEGLEQPANNGMER